MLSIARLRSLQSVAIQLGLSRETLLAGIDPQLVAVLPNASARSEQLLLDLVELSHAGALTDDSKPLVIWLHNALHLAPLRKEAEVFRNALAELGEPVDGTATGPTPAKGAAKPERTSSNAAAKSKRAPAKGAAKQRRPAPAAKAPTLTVGARAIVNFGDVSGSTQVTGDHARVETPRSSASKSPGRKKA